MRKKNILVCDDDDAILQMITELLRLNEQYHIIPVSRGEEVLAYLKNGQPPPDLMILDLWLPDRDSDEIIPEIRREEHTKHIPIILMSAIIRIDMVARSLGVEEWLAKPFLPEDLEYKVSRLLPPD